MNKWLATCCLLGGLSSPTLSTAAVYDIQMAGKVRMIEGDAGGSGIFVGDDISARFQIDESNYGQAYISFLGGGAYSTYFSTLRDFKFSIGSYSVSLPSIAGTVTYMNNAFGTDGIVISPDTLEGGPFNSTRTLPQFQFRGPSNAIGEGGVANGLPLAAFSPSLFVGFGNNTGTNRVFGDLTVSISSVVPELATWTMMLIGFGMVGGSARYRRRTTKITYA